MSWFPWARLDPNERLATPILLRELGVFKSLKVGRAIRRRQKKGDPFSHLEPPSTDEDRLSREQIGPAILLYQELLKVVDGDSAWRVTEEIVVEAACVFLRQSIGELRRDELATLDATGRERFVQERGRKFFNATVTWEEISGERVHFTVTHCKFPPLCVAAGVPELAPIFCKGDARYFGTIEPDVELKRPHTIAEGASTCAFRLGWNRPLDGGEPAKAE